MKYVALLLLILLVSSVKSDINYERWMEDNKDFIANKTLYNIVLPGTHDTGSYRFSDNIAPGGSGAEFDAFIKLAEILHIPIADVIRPWSLTQTGNITQQLLSGFRHFDLRAILDHNNWYTYHALEGNLIHDIIIELKNFITSHPFEIVFVEVGHTYPSVKGYNNTELLYLISDLVGDYMIKKDMDNNKELYDITLKEMWEMNRRLIFSFDEFSDTLYNDYFYYHTSICEGVYANTPKVDEMIKHNDDMIKGRVEGFIMQVSYTLTATTDTILSSILPNHPKSVIDLAKKAQKELNNWLAKHKTDLFGSIIDVDDFVNCKAVVDFAIEMAKIPLKV